MRSSMRYSSPAVFVPPPLHPNEVFVPQASAGGFGQVESTTPANNALSVMFRHLVEPPINYQDNACSICQQEFEHHDQVVRLPCRHVFHLQCYDEYVSRSNAAATCPNCGGSGEVIARWAYVLETEQEHNQNADMPSDSQNEVQTPPATSRSGTTFHTPATDPDDVNVHFAWWPVSRRAC